jgi:hypothetical protein
MQNEPSVEVKEEVLPARLRPFQPRAAESIDPVALSPQRAPRTGGLDVGDGLAGEGRLEGPGRAMDGVAFGHSL